MFVFVSMLLFVLVDGSIPVKTELTVEPTEGTVTLIECKPDHLKIAIDGFTNEGIIYLRGDNVDYMQCTNSTMYGYQEYVFNFTTCGITWESNFKVVVQQHALIQTINDTVLPVRCLRDLSDVSVNLHVNATDADPRPSQDVRFKASAQMRIYTADTRDDITYGTVALGDKVRLVIALDGTFKGVFDILVMNCTASNLPIISEACPIFWELFPAFVKVEKGEVASEFLAFRTTDQPGRSVKMVFTCMLSVCSDTCLPATCTDGSEGYGRKKRAYYDYREDGYDKINVQAALTIMTRDDKDIAPRPSEHTELSCEIDMKSFVAGLSALGIALLISAIVSIILARKLVVKNKPKPCVGMQRPLPVNFVRHYQTSKRQSSPVISHI